MLLILPISLLPEMSLFLKKLAVFPDNTGTLQILIFFFIIYKIENLRTKFQKILYKNHHNI